MNASKGSELINDEGAAEIKVETVDHRIPAGQDKEPQKHKVEVTHLIHAGDKPGTGGAAGEAAAKVVEKLGSAKEAVLGSTGHKNMG